ncbi:hypothetical protein CHLRE_10g465500v5 [Chlamydomonas reinhardtii]|uniref:AB hydrolase-1 domain-containing protein n=1 Tax=Chlamydomonas reinhardtii TaxID=3055 RepID=A0A2K3DC81_CHLRE|nr:uncharacterized protein CHLRE_10g465500v5 [Chlamydomonas reinhardtii]PNW78133.1 hypothetical protein CHLRE_10g465500v5 [Chlamydomonas reinhardtii]
MAGRRSLQVPLLSKHFRCVALDLPGHGQAPAPTGPISEADLVAAVQDYVEREGVRGAFCMGHSLGGTLAALLEWERPGTFRSMFLFEPVLRPHLHMAPPASPPPPPPPPPPHAQQQQQQQSGSVEAGSGGGGGGAGAAAAGAVQSPLARLARKRQAFFPSVEAAVAALGAKPPFSAFSPLALHAYLACGGLRPVQPEPGQAAGGTGGSAAAAAAAAGGSSSSGGSSSGGVTLACAPESEARVFDALALPPWRPWGDMGGARCCGSSSSRSDSGSSCGGSSKGAAPGAASASACCSCSGSSSSSSSSSSGGAWCGRCCRVAVAVGRAVAGGLHSALPVFGAALAEQVPGAQLIRFPALGHLGPMEDPAAVAAVALHFFQTGGAPATAAAAAAAATAGTPAPASRL